MSVSRRGFLTAGGAIAVATGSHLPVGAAEAREPHVPVGKAKHFVVGKPVSFNYPDAQAPALAIRMSSAVPNGVGPHGDIIAYSQLCVHKGCPVGYNPHEEICRLSVPLEFLRPGKGRRHDRRPRDHGSSEDRADV